MNAALSLTVRAMRPLLWSAPEATSPRIAELAAEVRGGAVLHGSGERLEQVEARQQLDYTGKPVIGIFATRDPIWPVFYATIDRRTAGTVRAQCVPGRHGTKYGFSTLADPGWRHGWVHVLSGQGFTPVSGTCELVCTSLAAIKPINAIEVRPEDFPFQHRTGHHTQSEPVWHTWWRLRKRGR